MKNMILTVMLLGLLTGASFAQRGRAPMDANRGMTQMGPYAHTNPIAPTPQLVRPNAIQTPGTVRPNAIQMPPVTTLPKANPATTSPTTTTGTPNTLGSTSSGTPGRVPNAIQPDARQMPPIAHTSAQ